MADDRLLGDGVRFKTALQQALEMNGQVEPIDATQALGMMLCEGRIRIGAISESNTIWQESTTLVKVAGALAVDRRRLEASLDKNNGLVMTERLEKQERKPNADNHLPRIWVGPEEPRVLTAEERETAFDGITEAIKELWIADRRIVRTRVGRLYFEYDNKRQHRDNQRGRRASS